jgi:CRISPR-associated endoribonuclease Cas6
MVIKYLKLTFTIEAIDPIVLPNYKGSTFRGGFGNALRRVVCALKRKDCKDCLLKTRCVYAYIFETSPAEDTRIMNMKKYESIPHPFIIEPPLESVRVYRPKEMMSFNLILIGRAIDYLPYFIYTFDELGKTGIGKGRGRYNLIEAAEDSRVVYSSEDKTVRNSAHNELNMPEITDIETASDSAVTLRFLTPVRLHYKRDLVVDLEFHILIRSLLRRLCLLYYFHCENREPAWDHKELISMAEKVAVESNALKWRDWERYSSRQDTRMKMGGLVGDITFRGDVGPFIPLLKAGEMLHIGKGTSFGLGKYEMDKRQKLT